MKRMHLCAAAIAGLTGVIFSFQAQAQEMGDLPFYNLTPEEQNRDYFTWKVFLENQNREPCQHYLEPPPGFVFKGCDLVRPVQQSATLMQQTEVQRIEPAAGEPAPAPALPSSYTVYFDFDRDNIRTSEEGTLNQAAQQIMQQHPQKITIYGHADTAGPSDYNDSLSQRRVRAVENALHARGIKDVLIDAIALGESQPAVQTGDGVPEQSNRRAVIDFNRP